MEAESLGVYKDQKEPVILMLPGMKRQWVFSKGQGWVEYIVPKILTKNIDENEIQYQEDETTKKKKWWQFWKKS